MTPPAISVRSLSKRFRLGETHGYRLLSEALGTLATAPLRKLQNNGKNARPQDDPPKRSKEYLWALRDVTFDVQAGEVFGIIGANGAGKSTLLKILSKITEPTAGEVDLRGRVGSLLEVGTGFHPELTGRENVFINGAILGMTQREIRSRFDAIIDFSGIEDFIDTPVKRYSSGMQTRLAFAVAAHLDPEIMIVDEVLAVGDAQFQQKCLGKMENVADQGRTILLVSHNMKTIRNMCSRTMWIDQGSVRTIGETDEVITDYLRANQRAETLADVPDRIAALPDDPAFRLHNVILRQLGAPTNRISNSEPVEVEIEYEVRKATPGLRVYFDLCDQEQDILVRSFFDDDANARDVLSPGRYRSVATIPANFLAPREYIIVVRAGVYNERSITGTGLTIEIHVDNTSQVNRAYPNDVIRAKLQPKFVWNTKPANG